MGYCLLLRAEQMEINTELLSTLSNGPAGALAKLQGRGRVNISAELFEFGDPPDDLQVLRLGDAEHLPHDSGAASD